MKYNQSIWRTRVEIHERYKCEGRSIDTPVHQKPGNVNGKNRHRPHENESMWTASTRWPNEEDRWFFGRECFNDSDEPTSQWSMCTQPSPTMPSNCLPLRVRLSAYACGRSRLMSLSDTGSSRDSSTSTQPFQPFFTATRFFRGGLGATRRGRSSSSSGVCGLLEEVRETLDESDGPGVEPGVEGYGGGDIVGGGVMDRDRCKVVMWMVGRL